MPGIRGELIGAMGKVVSSAAVTLLLLLKQLVRNDLVVRLERFVGKEGRNVQQGIRRISLAIDDDRRPFSLPRRNFKRINKRFEKPSKIVALKFQRRHISCPRIRREARSVSANLRPRQPAGSRKRHNYQ